MCRKGFTLIELMVVVLIVAVLAAILIPMLTARLEAARWSEGKAGCGTLATCIRAMYAEEGEENFIESTDPLNYMSEGDLRGKYFCYQDYTITFDEPTEEYPVAYIISVGQPKDPIETVRWTKIGYSLDYMGRWMELTE